MIRSVNSHPTVTTFQCVIRNVLLGAYLSSTVPGSNVDNVEQMNVLLTISKCLEQKVKECDIEASDLKAVMEDKLLKEITIRYVEMFPQPKKHRFC